jgi:hypothetical protein
VEIKHNKSQPDSSDDRQNILRIVKSGAQVSTVNARELNANANSIDSLTRIFPHDIRAPTLSSRVQIPNQLEIEFPAQPAIKVTRCPKCQSRNRTRTARNWWMRLLPGSRYYQCYSCYQRYLRWCGNSIAH